MATKIKKRSPKKELNTWLRVNRSWDHSEWKDLLKSFSNQCIHELCPSISGQNDISFYLETKRH